MSIQYVTQIIDDVDGAVLTEHDRVRFCLGDRAYEFDTTPERAREFRRQLQAYIDVAHPVEPEHMHVTGQPCVNGHAATHAWTIRTWGWAHGFDVAERGPLPREVIDAFNEAHVEDRPPQAA